MTGAIATHENGITLTVRRMFTHPIVTLGTDTLFSFRGKGYVFSPHIAARFTLAECQAFKVDFGAWLTS